MVRIAIVLCLLVLAGCGTVAIDPIPITIWGCGSYVPCYYPYIVMTLTIWDGRQLHLRTVGIFIGTGEI